MTTHRPWCKAIVLVGLVASVPACGGGASSKGDAGIAATGDGGLHEADVPQVVLDAFTQEAVTRADAPNLDNDGPADAASPEPDAASCGTTGLACCAGNSCAAGGCCVLGQCVANSAKCGDTDAVCKSGSCGGCGAVGEPCCDRGACTASGTRCVGNLCTVCGQAADAACCAGNSCLATGLYCTRPADGVCATCGVPGTPCCPGGNACAGGACCYGGSCVPSGSSCGVTAAGGMCAAGRCSACGGKGQACCGATCYGPGTRCDPSGLCVPCGAVNDVCCAAAVPCSPGAVCTASGRCDACGAAGGACCAGGQCAGSGCCLAGRCVGPGNACTSFGVSYGLCADGQCACGRQGQSCCPPRSTCNEPDTQCLQDARGVERCERCGTAGGNCCDGNRCAAGGCCVPQANGPSLCLGGGGQCPNGMSCGAGGACGGCGGLGQACCVSGTNVRWCSASATTCSPQTSKCESCGKLGEPCCTAYAGMTAATGTCDGTLRCAFRGVLGYACVGGAIVP